MSEFYRTMRKLLAEHGSVERRTDTETGKEALFLDGRFIIGDDGDYSQTERIKAEPVLILFGAGHVGKALYDLAMLQGMRTIVLDDREELLTEQRFPQAERHIGPFSKLLSREYDAISPYYTIFTHGHSYDKDCLRYALSHKSAYIGMIGSKKKASVQLEAMIQEGFPEDDVSKVHSPIGLSINAVTPEEIAVAIMAEIITTFRDDRNTISIDGALLDALADKKGMTVRIIEKEGSAPRGKGTMMFVTEDGVYSTIGGGAVERLAIRHAEEMLREGIDTDIVDYGLESGGNTGMICGGNLRVLFRARG